MTVGHLQNHSTPQTYLQKTLALPTKQLASNNPSLNTGK